MKKDNHVNLPIGVFAPPFVRNPYNYDTNAASDAAGEYNNEPSKTKQSFAEECDINTIVKRFHLTGELPTNVRMPTYGDFTEIPDFHSAMNAIALAGEAFDRMPAEVRARFNNDPGAFVDFCSDPKNKAEAAKLGLIDADKWAEIQKQTAATAAENEKAEAAKAAGKRDSTEPAPAKETPPAKQQK